MCEQCPHTDSNVCAMYQHGLSINLANTIELVLPSAHPSPQPKRQIDRFSRFAQLTVESPYTLQWAPLSRQNCPFPWRDLDTHLSYDSLGQYEPTMEVLCITGLLHF